MTSVAQMLIVMGLPISRETNGPGKKVWKRGRGSLAEPCPELKIKPCLGRWMTEEEATAELGTNHEGIISMIKSRELRPAIHKGRIFISIESVRKKTGRAVQEPPPEPVQSEPVLTPVIPADPEPDPEPEQELEQEVPSPEPDPEDSLDDYPEEREEFIPTQLTEKITNSKAWTYPSYPPKRAFVSSSGRELAIELVEYAPGEYGYWIEDVAEAINKVPEVVRNFIAGHKVKADPTGRYVTQESLKAFIRKSRGIEIRDIEVPSFYT